MDEEVIKQKKSGGRGRETLFRVSYQNQINLTKIADNKAHLIITINSIIITVIFGIAGYNKGKGLISESPMDMIDLHFLIPLLLVLIASLLSITFAILAAKPNVRKPKKNTKNLPPQKSSLLFFANISSKSLDNYIIEMKELIKSRNSIYENMIIDIYNQAKVLTRKYNMLGIAYQIFMYGFILGVLAFIFVYLVI